VSEIKLDLIDLDQELPGQRRFISCWLGQGQGTNFIVDPGPPATGDYLVGELERLGLERLDLILLTHIHLDHGGATARILERWPEARVACHKAGRKHLIDPSRLWQGSLQVLGHKAEVYGEPQPVPEHCLLPEGAAIAPGVRSIATPGHAPHHLAFLVGEDLFVGEAAGTFSALQDGEKAGLDFQGEEYYLRPATPPRFVLPVATESLTRLLALQPRPRRLCFAHHGSFCGDVAALLAAARDQLELWVGVIARWLERNAGGGVSGPSEDETALLDGLARALREADPRFARGGRLPADIRAREQDFTRQTLRGMLGYLETLEGHTGG
jgi:glyoxylase-like metal-dependent hydrolase (beta-lactamase superfamily II)